ncbi:hypothetical protein CARUB_v10022160mg [Capsella rubella]|uniref:Uncharacterized protein n=1 Tax=Capsella rubella TaxID=81985 RepID=R0GFJ9_9BRAS|nr:hypothetical protein CARUB_v10022160mg [Capsella rubella]
MRKLCIIIHTNSKSHRSLSYGTRLRISVQKIIKLNYIHMGQSHSLPLFVFGTCSCKYSDFNKDCVTNSCRINAT